ncbi:hypothetical protein J7T55_004785 [Diaporthe amygdali]|uniref:uncharacterized protein n=1 Tax=Phomopsis amygdali TaxID=1214568 RepID=UPI0022FE1511|nr:uncharacterized protein J7T55_004785 [Diaporthe amygdali]KAJ0114541.1 hypothetical protein J7T55_004785 [Diaporthe amygdali]
MPPRRGRGGNAGGGTPSPAPDSRPRAQRTPGPSRFSTSYGSPAMLTAGRSTTSSSIGGIGNALRNVQNATSADRRTRAAQQAAEGGNQGARPPPNQGPAAPLDQGPAPPPNQGPVVPPVAQKTAGPATNNQQNPAGSRAQTVQPQRQRPDSGTGNRRYSRYMSAPLHSDTPSMRSFIEESEIFHGADVGTPTPGRNRAPVISNRPNQGPNFGPLTADAPSDGSDGSDFIDDDDDEDPLNRDTPRSTRSRRDSATTPQSQSRPPPSYQAVSWADRFTQRGGFGTATQASNQTGTATQTGTQGARSDQTFNPFQSPPSATRDSVLEDLRPGDRVLDLTSEVLVQEDPELDLPPEDLVLDLVLDHRVLGLVLEVLPLEVLALEDPVLVSVLVSALEGPVPEDLVLGMPRRLLFKDREGRKERQVRRVSREQPDCPVCRGSQAHKDKPDLKDNQEPKDSPGLQDSLVLKDYPDSRVHRGRKDRKDRKGRKGRRGRQGWRTMAP